MKIFVLGKIGSITYWLEDAVAAFCGAGHDVRLGVTRHPWLNAKLEHALVGPMAARIGRRIRQFAPDLILGIGAYHIEPTILEAIAGQPRRPPLIAWVGDAYADSIRPAADLFDVVGYTDSGLLARHQDLGFAASAFYLPHAVNPRRAPERASEQRLARLVFVANPTPYRQAVVDAIDTPIALFGPAWTQGPGARHDIHARRIVSGQLMGAYARHFAALNLRNEQNVLHGLNQRSFDPYLAATPVVTDNQPDVDRCFEPEAEVLVYRGVEELNEIYGRLRRSPSAAADVGQRGRRRVLSQHTYGHRLASVIERLS